MCVCVHKGGGGEGLVFEFHASFLVAVGATKGIAYPGSSASPSPEGEILEHSREQFLQRG